MIAAAFDDDLANRNSILLDHFAHLGVDANRVDIAHAYSTFDLPYSEVHDIPANDGDLPAPSAFKAKKNSDPDTLTYEEAMNSPDCDKWKAAMQEEIDSLVKQGTWEEVPKSDATSPPIPGTWVFRIKRTPDGRIKKYKARYCCRGDLESDEADS